MDSCDGITWTNLDMGANRNKRNTTHVQDTDYEDSVALGANVKTIRCFFLLFRFDISLFTSLTLRNYLGETFYYIIYFRRQIVM